MMKEKLESTLQRVLDLDYIIKSRTSRLIAMERAEKFDFGAAEGNLDYKGLVIGIKPEFAEKILQEQKIEFESEIEAAEKELISLLK